MMQTFFSTKAEAMQAGHKKYMDGKPCKRGHVAARFVSNGMCCECSKAAQSTDHAKARKAAHYLKNRELALARAAARYEQNRPQIIQYSLEYQRKNIKEICARREAKFKEKLKTSPWLGMFRSVRATTNAAIRRVGASKNGRRTLSILGCTSDELKAHIERQFVRGMTWENRTEWHVDHIIPLCTATNEEEAIALCHYTNLRPMWAIDNLKKSGTRTHLI